MFYYGFYKPELKYRFFFSSQAFQKYGEIVKVKIIRDIVTGFSKCYGFVEFEKEKCALRARQDAHEDVIDERVVFVDWEFSRSLSGWVPRRLG